MDNQPTTTKQYTPVKLKLFWALTLLAVFLVLAFTFVLRYSYRTPVKINPSGYSTEMPDGFLWECTKTTEGGALTLDGWACIAGERILLIDNFVVLYDSANNTYWKMPTIAILNSAATETIGGDILYDRAGFSSVTPLKKIKKDPAAYELCFLYKTNGHGNLIHTGVNLGGI